MYKRTFYLEKIKPFIDKPVVKVISGMRRSGKSVFMRQIIAELKKRKVRSKNILYIDKESLEFDFIRSYQHLDQYVNKQFKKTKGKKYLFIDEIQEIDKWEKTICSIMNKGKTDVFITGSNAHLFSSELATLISGRYLEFPVYPFSFSEFYEYTSSKSESPKKAFNRYIKFGGLPALPAFGYSEDIAYHYIQSIYDTILLKDVIRRNKIRNIRFLENITRYIFDNIGNIFSAKRIADFVKAQGLRIGMDTVHNYISFLLDSYCISKVGRYDIKGKRMLEINEKYFLADIGLRHALLGFREGDVSGLLENVVYNELLKRGYSVSLGKLGVKEIDFIAQRQQEKIYLQVSYLLSTQKTIEREFAPLLAVNDNYPKYVISLDPAFGADYEGIRHKNLIDFLLEKG